MLFFNRWLFKYYVINLNLNEQAIDRKKKKELLKDRWILHISVVTLTILSINQNQHDWQAAEGHMRTHQDSRSMSFTVSGGSLVISTTPVGCCSQISQWAPRVLLVKTGNRAWSTEWDPSTRSPRNLNRFRSAGWAACALSACKCELVIFDLFIVGL